MDLKNTPNMQGTRIGGGYMVVVYGSGGDLMDVYDLDWWRIYGGCIWTRIGSGYLVIVYGGGDDDGVAAT